MGRGSPHDFPSGLVGTPKAKFAIYAGTPDSQSWQHFLDRVTHVLLQVLLGGMCSMIQKNMKRKRRKMNE